MRSRCGRNTAEVTPTRAGINGNLEFARTGGRGLDRTTAALWNPTLTPLLWMLLLKMQGITIRVFISLPWPLVLSASISLEGVEQSISSLLNSKSPGLDDLPAHSQYMAPLLLKLHNEVYERGRLPVMVTDALIVVNAGPGKDLNYCESYRPISLLEVCRVTKIILDIIH